MTENEVGLKLLKEFQETNFAAYTTKYGEKAGFFFAAALPRECHIAELETQIEKMKCCYNCKQSQDESYCKIKKSDVEDLSCWDCGCDKWEIKEK